MPMHSMFKPLAVGLVAAALGSSAQAAVSSFDSGNEGWLLAGDATTAVPSWLGAGGNPGGYVHGVDTVTGGVWFWQAPAAFLGNASSSYGQTLSFDLRMRGSGTLFADRDVVLSGGGLTIAYDFATLPQDVAWTHYSVSLSDSAAWKLDTLGGATASAAQIQTVLASLTSLRIRGEFITGADNGDLDNVVMGVVPEPGTWALWLAGLAGIGFAARRSVKAAAA